MIKYVSNGKCKFLEDLEGYYVGNQYNITDIPEEVIKKANVTGVVIKNIMIPVESAQPEPEPEPEPPQNTEVYLKGKVKKRKGEE